MAGRRDAEPVSRWSLAASAVLVLGLAVLVGLSVGPADIGVVDVLGALGSGDDVERTILLGVRFPRVVAAGLTGAVLAVSGVIFQALLRNPLAEPYLLGVSAGAGFGAVAALATGVAALSAAVLPLAALAGALVAIAIVLRVAWVVDRLDTRVMILAGVVVSSFFGAGIMLMLTFSRAETLQSAIFWTMGGFSGVSWRMSALLAAYGLPAVVAAYLLGRHYDTLALGEDAAASLGTEVERVKLGSYLLASLLAAAAVSVAGVVGFVGLVVPHAVRMVAGPMHRRLIPLSFVGGAVLLILTDAVARTAAAPVEIPVGVMTAILGVPFFLVLLRRRIGA